MSYIMSHRVQCQIYDGIDTTARAFNYVSANFEPEKMNIGSFNWTSLWESGRDILFGFPNKGDMITLVRSEVKIRVSKLE